MTIGIIGGSGLYSIPGLRFIEEISMETSYGMPSDNYLKYRTGDHTMFFLSRHGRDHSFAPHTINYRANIEGFSLLGVDKIISISATGGIADGLLPGSIVIPDNAMDFTSGRPGTYYDTDKIYHVDMTLPFCGSLRKQIIEAARRENTVVRKRATSLCTNGPRLETAAEIKAYKAWGADIVGMTLFPECTLAREKGLCYANISVVTNYAAGIKDTPLTTTEVTDTMERVTAHIQKILTGILGLACAAPCACARSLEETGISKKKG